MSRSACPLSANSGLMQCSKLLDRIRSRQTGGTGIPLLGLFHFCDRRLRKSPGNCSLANSSGSTARKSLSDGVFGPVQAALCSTGLAMRGILAVEDEAMRLVVYGAVAAIALGSVLLGLDWLSAPMSPMVNTEAGLRVVAPPRAAVPATAPVATVSTPAPEVAAPKATIAAPIVSPNLAAPRSVELPASPLYSAGRACRANSTAQAVPVEPIAGSQPTVRCNVNACATAYPPSFRATDCTYQPSNGPRRLCAKETLVPQPAAAPVATVSTPAPEVAAPKATIAAPIVSPNLAAPRSVELPASPDLQRRPRLPSQSPGRSRRSAAT